MHILQKVELYIFKRKKYFDIIKKTCIFAAVFREP